MDEVTRRLNDAAIRHLPNQGGNPDRRAVLGLNQEIRKLDRYGGIPGGFGYELMNIPIDDMRVLQLRFPDLISLDPQIQHQAWLRFARAPESAPYKVRRNDGKRRRK